MKSSEQKILLVDDEKDILEFISYNLKKEGYEVLTASNGRDGIEMAGKYVPQLILLDVMMPEMDGIETCEEIRKIPGMENTVIAFLTARGEDYSQIAGFEAGGDDYIIKPIKPKVLISRIKALLKRYEYTSSGTMESEASSIRTESLILDLERFLVLKEDEELSLPKKELNCSLSSHQNPIRFLPGRRSFTRCGEMM